MTLFMKLPQNHTWRKTIKISLICFGFINLIRNCNFLYFSFNHDYIWLKLVKVWIFLNKPLSGAVASNLTPSFLIWLIIVQQPLIRFWSNLLYVVVHSLSLNEKLKQNQFHREKVGKLSETLNAVLFFNGLALIKCSANYPNIFFMNSNAVFLKDH